VNYVMKDTIDMKKHLKDHPYKKVNSKYQVYDFVEESHETMEVHVVMHRTNNIECGLRKLCAKSLDESLNL
jgi:hypothetical protein